MLDEPEALANLCAEPLSATAAVIIAAAIGALSALAGSFLAQRSADERYRKQAARDDRLHRERINQEDLHRFSNERRQAYASFLAGCIKLIVQSGSGNTPSLELLMETDRAYLEIVLMARQDIAEKANYLWACVSAISADPSLYKLRKKAFDDAVKSFEDAARDEIALAPTKGSNET